MAWRDYAWSLVLVVPVATVLGGVAYLFRDALGPTLAAWAPVVLVVLFAMLVLS